MDVLTHLLSQIIPIAMILSAVIGVALIFVTDDGGTRLAVGGLALLVGIVGVGALILL